MKTMKEPISIIDQRKSKKMKQIERLQALVTASDDDEMKVLYKKQLKQTINSLNMLAEEERVSFCITFDYECLYQLIVL